MVNCNQNETAGGPDGPAAHPDGNNSALLTSSQYESSVSEEPMTSIQPSALNNNVPSSDNQVSQSDTSKSQTTKSLGVAQNRDSFEAANKDTASVRQVVEAAKAEGKLPMTQNNLNRFIQNNVKPNQYAETFQDLKGFVSKNFYLTPKQQSELNSLNKQDTVQIQRSLAQAGQLNKRVEVQFVNPNPEPAQAKTLVLGKIMDQSKIMSADRTNETVSAQVDSSTTQSPSERDSKVVDKRKDLSQQIKEQEERLKELQKELEEAQEKGKKKIFLFFQDDPSTKPLPK